MCKSFLLSIFITTISICAFSQNINSLKLSDKEIPGSYNKPAILLCNKSLVEDIYNDPASYASTIGYMEKKDFQSFEKGTDKGTVLYFEFSDDLTEKEKDNLDALLSQNEEVYCKGKIAVIWCFDKSSEIKKISKAKIMKLLK